MSRWWWSCLALTACGRFDFDARVDGAASDGMVDATPCTTWSAWSAPQVVPVPGNPAHYMGTLTDDTRIIIYANYTDNTTIDDLYIATRATANDPFGTEALITELQTVDNEYGAVTRDGLSLYFAREIGGAPPEIMFTSRPSLSSAFAAPVVAMDLSNATAYDSTGWMSLDGLRFYMASDRAGDVDIYVAERASSSGSFTAPTRIPQLAAIGMDVHPVLTSDEREIIWASKRATARYDLYHATRASRTDPFGTPSPIAELNTVNDDTFPWLSPDGTMLYFNYNMLTSGGPSDVSISTRTCQ